MFCATWGCGSTANEDQLVLDFRGFDSEGLEQADHVDPGLAEVDVVPDCCEADPVTGVCTDAEPFMETAVNAVFINNQKLDITVDRYEVELPEAGLPVRRFSTSQTVAGKRCDIDRSRPCAVNADCVLGQMAGVCQPSASAVHLLLFDFQAKRLALAQSAPFGATFDVIVRISGRDESGARWESGDLHYLARFDNFDNCGEGM